MIGEYKNVSPILYYLKYKKNVKITNITNSLFITYNTYSNKYFRMVS